MIISGLVKSSFVDYPGLIAGVLFTPGCNYNCFYCHNRCLLNGAKEVIKPDSVKQFLAKRAGLLDAIVVTGGEPTLQKGLLPYLEEIKQYGYKIKLDSNGSSPKVISEVLQSGLCDYFAIDYKAPASRYAEFCGSNASAKAVMDTIGLLCESDVAFEVRTTVVPQLHENDLMQMARELPVLPCYILNRYRRPEEYLPSDRDRILEDPYTQAQVDGFKIMVKEGQPHTAA